MRNRRRRPSRAQALFLAIVVVLAIAGAIVAIAVGTRDSGLPAPAGGSVAVGATPVSGLPTVRVGELPVQARQTLALIDRGGPFAYAQDGAVFGNLEHHLPARPGGYYREYTVPTPGSPDRGARRLIRGALGDLYFTADHYDTFRQVLR